MNHQLFYSFLQQHHTEPTQANYITILKFLADESQKNNIRLKINTFLARIGEKFNELPESLVTLINLFANITCQKLISPWNGDLFFSYSWFMALVWKKNFTTFLTFLDNKKNDTLLNNCAAIYFCYLIQNNRQDRIVDKEIFLSSRHLWHIFLEDHTTLSNLATYMLKSNIVQKKIITVTSLLKKFCTSIKSVEKVSDYLFQLFQDANFDCELIEKNLTSIESVEKIYYENFLFDYQPCQFPYQQEHFWIRCEKNFNKFSDIIVCDMRTIWHIFYQYSGQKIKLQTRQILNKYVMLLNKYEKIDKFLLIFI